MRFSYPLQSGRNIRCALRRRGPVWYADFSIRGHSQHVLSTGEKELRRAKVAAEKLIVKTAGVYGRAHASAQLKGLADGWLLAKYPLDGTGEAYHLTQRTDKCRLLSFVAFAGEKLDLDSLDGRAARALVARYLNSLHERGLTNTTIDNHRLTLSRFFSWLIVEYRVQFEINPASRAVLGRHIYKPDTQPARPVTEADFERFRDVAQRKWYWIGIVLVAGAGMRPIGASRLKWSDVDLKARVLRVSEKGVNHTIALNDWILWELRRAKRRQIKRCGALGRGGLVIGHGRDWVTRRVTRLMKKVFGGKTEYRWRNLRNSFQQWLLDRGANVKDVASLAKNSEKIVLGKYAKSRATRLHDVANLLDFRPSSGGRKSSIASSIAKL